MEGFLLLKMTQKHSSSFCFRVIILRSRSPGIQQWRLLELLAPFSFTHRWRSGWPNPERKAWQASEGGDENWAF